MDDDHKLKGLQITSLDDNDDEVADSDNEDEDYDDYDDEEEEDPVTLGFVEKPKNKWSLYRQYFPSKAGGVPVLFIS